jgi:hypothetical protein
VCSRSNTARIGSALIVEANSSYRECVQPVRSSVPGLPENQFFEVAGINQQLIARPANGHKPDRVCKRRAQPIAVYGYTDDIGTQTYNLQLSRRRAEAVRDFLVQTGISPTIISTKGFGQVRSAHSGQQRTGPCCQPPGRDRHSGFEGSHKRPTRRAKVK